MRGIVVVMAVVAAWAGADPAVVDFSGAAVADAAGGVARTVLLEEVERRTGIAWPVLAPGAEAAAHAGPRVVLRGPETPGGPGAAESYRVALRQEDAAGPVLELHGADARGLLYAVGAALRAMDWGPGRVGWPAGLAREVAPVSRIRGHQLGYRHTANSYDAWSVAQYDQYIRELALFGANAIENIPFQCESSVVMPVTREAMNIAIAEICAGYGLAHWVWCPAEIDLADVAAREALLAQHEDFFAKCPRLDAVFFPGGDPGDNPARLVMPYLEELTRRLRAHHPKAEMWLSLQGFGPRDVKDFYAWLDAHAPAWLAGVVSGPQSPAPLETRRLLPARYGHRLYPDITHTLLCQHPVPWWDPAWAFTLGREPVNPRPQYYAGLARYYLPHSDGVLTYSDGIHDDVNKTVWSALAFDPAADVVEVLRDYARLFFGPGAAQAAADGILALERNWDGPIATHGGIEATGALWDALDAQHPALRENWRWRALLLRADYDRHTRRRAEYEAALEREANAVLDAADRTGAAAAIDAALAVLARADAAPCCPELRARIEAHGAALFEQIGLQTSVEKYHARNFERGAVLDFLDRPLNNRWWLEDQCARIRTLGGEPGRVAALRALAHWEDPVPGARYDDIGNVARSPHALRGETALPDGDMLRTALPDYGTWMESGRSRWRLSWLTNISWPEGLVYEGLDPARAYTFRVTGRGNVLPRFDGERAGRKDYAEPLDAPKTFTVPRSATADGTLTVTFDRPLEPGINWRQQSIVVEAWLLPE